jgi:hypothetical protein
MTSSTVSSESAPRSSTKVRHLVLFDAELFGNDAFNLFFNAAHSGSFS